MSNLFSIFDPQIYIWNLKINLNWVSVMILISLISVNFWVVESPINKMWKTLAFILNNEIKLNFSTNLTPGMTHLILSYFIFVVVNNYMGLIPYVFTASSHLTFTLSIALFSWLSYVLWVLIKDMESFLSHLTPTGTPYLLMPFMVIIELTSSIIRPITLSVRLAANMVAGHLLLTLISSPMSPISSITLNFIILAVIMMMILENAVALIQSYVFTMLSSLYLSETNSVKNYLNNFLTQSIITKKMKIN